MGITTEITHSDQVDMMFAPADYLNVHQGIVDPLHISTFEYDPEARLNLTQLSGRIGRALVEGARTDHTDPPLGVYAQDFSMASFGKLKHGLYIPKADPRYATAQQLVTINNSPVRLNTKGVVARDTGVVMPAAEFHIIGRSARDFSKAIQAKTRRAVEDRRPTDEVPDIESENDAVKRSAIHGLAAKEQALFKLDAEYLARRALFARMYRDTMLPWRTAFRAKNLIRDFTEAQEHIQDTVGLAMLNLEDYSKSTTVSNAVHRAISSRMFREPDQQRAANIREALTFTGLHNNAKRGKISQSLRGIQTELHFVRNQRIKTNQ